MRFNHFLQLIRFKNLLLLIFMMLLFTYFIYHFISISEPINLTLLIISIICITIFGNIINDVFDVKIDLINKPNKVVVKKHVTKKTAIKLSYFFVFTGNSCGLILSFLIGKSYYSLIFILSTLLLFLYSKYLKKIAIIGNLTVSLLITLSIFLVYLFSKVSHDGFQNFKIFPIIATYMFFAFILNFIREIIKDIEDIDGDYNQDLKTLPILIGRKRTQRIIFALTTIPLFLCVYFSVSIFELILTKLYTLFLIIMPLVYFMYKIINVKSKKELHQLSTILKFIMFFGMCSILIIQY